jgi:serine/threonine protein kinase
MASPHRASRIGTQFGPYQLRSLIGVGGMGEVYRAFDTVKDRMVAVKLLRPELAADAGFQERFRRESRVAARLQEPHIIPVHDWGDIGGVLYIDMRLVDGSNVKTVLTQSGPMPPGRAASIVGQVAAALDAAHADGLVHRDVKPENVLITAGDFAYLVDFGIAHVGADSGLTTAGAAIGSCAYMAPERFTGGAVGPQSDVYSLACLLYECLTGQPPFPAPELGQVMSAHMFSAPPRPSAARPGLNPAFDDVIARGMAKQPAARFGSAGELARAAFAATASPNAPVKPRPQAAKPPATRQFSQQWPTPAGSAFGPYADVARRPAVPVQQRRRFGRTQLVLAVGSVAMLAAAALLAVLLVAGVDWGGSQPADVGAPPAPSATEPTAETSTTPSTSSSPTSTSSTTTSQRPPVGVTGADARGFVAYPGARCNDGNTAAATGRTAKSLLVVCRTGPADFYYRGLRLSDGATIELGNALPSSGGFDVTNPVDGTRYEVRPQNLSIVGKGGNVDSFEPMVEYAST